jgi:hypothetical protein
MDNVDPAESLSNSFGTGISKAVRNMANKMSDISEFAPTITPVLDLTKVQKEASKINRYVSPNALAMSLSYGHARTISNGTQPSEDVTPPPPSTPNSGGVNFEQNIYSPTRLSTSDIYKQTRNQITLAKEELKIP